jgi:hypothetical protein
MKNDGEKQDTEIIKNTLYVVVALRTVERKEETLFMVTAFKLKRSNVTGNTRGTFSFAWSVVPKIPCLHGIRKRDRDMQMIADKTRKRQNKQTL